MPDIKILSEAQLRALVPLDVSAIDCVERAFAALAAGEVEMPPILSMEIHENNGEIDVKTAYIAGADSFAIKMASGFYDNSKLGLPTSNGIMVVFSARTGQVEALLLDNGYLTEVRTAAAGGVAARHLARSDASRACVIGAGGQARLQLGAIHQVRPLRHIDVWARDAAKAKVAANEISAMLGVSATAVSDCAAAVSAADIVVTTTPARDPLVSADWLHKGQLVIAMGSDQDGKCEIDPAAIAKADHYIPDRLSQTRVLGELRAAIAAGLVSGEADFPELGDIIATRPDDFDPTSSLIICDLTGTGVQDTAIAALAGNRAVAKSAGTRFHS